MLAVLLLNRMNKKRRIARKQCLSKPDKVEKKVPEVVYCRTCLSTEDLVPIFASKDQEKKRSHDLHLVTGLEIKMDDDLSQKICGKCINIMKTALQFRRTSKKAEKTLLEMAGKKSKKKCKLKKKVTKTSKTKEINDENNEIDFGYDAGDDFQNDDFGDDDGFQDEIFRNDEYLGIDNSPLLMEVRSSAKAKNKPESKGRRKGPAAPPGPHKCPTCGKEFRMKATYKAHMRFHTNYCVCETCGKRCRNNNQLQEHKRARHGLGRIHRCAYCDYTSATKEALTIHERRHTGERPYVCDHCGATFHRRSNLVQHIAIHLPEKNFQCDMCPKRLKSRKFLQIHKHNAHTGRRYGYLCAVCDHRFEKPNKVRAHARRVHGLPDERQGPIVRVQL